MRIHKYLFLITVFSLFSCAEQSGSSELNTTDIQVLLNDQVECWNNGDIPCFMQGYWKSDSLMFIGKNGITKGWANTLERYQKNYPDKATMGELHFEIMQIKALGDDAAWVVGKFHLTREMGDAEGYFTLLFKKIQGQWRIVADHTS